MDCQCPGSAQFAAAVAVPRIEQSKTTTDAMRFMLILIPWEEVGFAPNQVVAEHAVECGEQRLAPRPSATLAEQRRKLRQQAVEPMPDEPDHPVDTPVDQTRDTGRPVPLRPGDHSRDDGDIVMHRLDQFDDPADAGDGQPADPAKIGSMYL